VPLKQGAGLEIVTAGYRADIDRVRFDQLLLKKPQNAASFLSPLPVNRNHCYNDYRFPLLSIACA
jgi:hypothetical protein